VRAFNAQSRNKWRGSGPQTRTTTGTKHIDERLDLVDRNFHAPAPNRLWVADITYVRTTAGLCYTAFITDNRLNPPMMLLSAS